MELFEEYLKFSRKTLRRRWTEFQLAQWLYIPNITFLTLLYTICFACTEEGILLLLPVFLASLRGIDFFKKTFKEYIPKSPYDLKTCFHAYISTYKQHTNQQESFWYYKICEYNNLELLIVKDVIAAT